MNWWRSNRVRDVVVVVVVIVVVENGGSVTMDDVAKWTFCSRTRVNPHQ